MLLDLQVSALDKEGGICDPAVLVAGLKKAGLDGAVITGADGQFPDLGPFRAAAAGQDVQLFAGARVPTNHGLLLAVMAEPQAAWTAGEGGLFEAEQVIEAVEAKGGVTVALRPYDRDVSRPMGDHIFTLHGIAACEVLSGRLSQSANELALEAASNLELPCVGSSGSNGAEALGTVATLFRVPLKDEADLIEALRHGDCWPVTFSANVPAARPAQRERGERSERGGGGADRGGHGDRGRRRRRRGGRGGSAPREGGEVRGAAATPPPAAEGDRRGTRRRRSRRGGRGGGPVAEDAGNRIRNRPNEPLSEDFGNVRRSDSEDFVAEDIGNRLKPGERPIFHRPAPPEVEEDDDGTGNR